LVEIVNLTAAEARAWGAIFDLAAREHRGWTLIGAQTVALHAAEHRHASNRLSRDFDVLVDIRLLDNGTERITRELVSDGFKLDDPSPEGVSHRLRRDELVVDVLAPDGVGSAARLTTLPPSRTVSVPGGTQALSPTQWIEVSVGGRRAKSPDHLCLGRFS
jgi:hypothetical protein